MITKRWKQRVIELAKVHGPFVRFFPEGSEGGDGEGGGEGTATSVVNADGSFVENWMEPYGEKNKAHLSRYKDLPSLVKSHIDTKSKLGRNPDALVEVPSETSSDEVKAAWVKAHNVPETYEYALSDEMAVKLGPLDDKKMTALREFGKSKNWSQADFKDILDFYHNSVAADIDTFGEQTTKQTAEDAEKAKAELRNTDGWRSDAEYNAKVQRAQSVMEKYGGVDAIAKANLQNAPWMVKFLDNIAEAMSEDTLKGLAAPTGTTAANINAQITEVRLQMDAVMKKNPVNFKNSPEYKDLEQRKRALYKQKMSA